MHILEQHKNAVAKEKVNIVAVDSTHGKNSNASRAVGRSENPVGAGGNYRKVAGSSLCWLVAHFQIFRRLMKGKFDAYVL